MKISKELKAGQYPKAPIYIEIEKDGRTLSTHINNKQAEKLMKLLEKQLGKSQQN